MQLAQRILPVTETDEDDGRPFLTCDRRLSQVIEREFPLVAPSMLPILFLGETGCGKNVLAEKAHRKSGRRKMELVTVDVSTIPRELIESELFGHENGSFTGARSSRKGMIRKADRSTLFLDEIGELPDDLQAKFLRVLETGKVRPVGADEETEVDVRWIFATTKDLPALAAAGKFRLDLFHRINGWVLRVPPLRARKEDIEMISRMFFRKAGETLEHRMSTEAKDALLSHTWPGNVRELEMTLGRAQVLSGGGIIEPRHLQIPQLIGNQESRLGANAGITVGTPLQEAELRLVELTFASCNGKKGQTAEILGIERSTLDRKLQLIAQMKQSAPAGDA